MTQTTTAAPDVSTFQGRILALQQYWAEQGCVLMQPLDMEVGAGTFHPATFLRAIGPETWNTAYVQPCRRPTDGRYGENPNRLQHYYQFQVILKPSPSNIQELYLGSLQKLGIDTNVHDIRFVEDNWESPTLGAWGLGWEIWLNGMEITQFTYFQQVGGQSCEAITGELAYGVERLAMYLQDIDNVYDLVWCESGSGILRYGDIFQENERQSSHYNFHWADTRFLKQQFDQCFDRGEKLIEELVVLNNLKPQGLQFFRDAVLSATLMLSFLKSREGMGIYIDSNEPYFRLKIEGHSSGTIRTLLLPE